MHLPLRSDPLAKVSRQGRSYRGVVEICYLLRRRNVGSIYLLLRRRISQRQGSRTIFYFTYTMLYFIPSWPNLASSIRFIVFLLQLFLRFSNI